MEFFTEIPQSRRASITPQAFRDCFKCSPAEFRMISRLMTESGKVRDGSWPLEDAVCELRTFRHQVRAKR
jgi:hypothetical protein